MGTYCGAFYGPLTVSTAQNSVAASFTVSGPGTQKAFTDTSAASGGVTASSWAWDFGDGQTSTSQNPTHNYATQFTTYAVSLRTTFSNGKISIAYGTTTTGVFSDNGYYVPINAAGFTALGITPPNSLWLFQEASGNAADSIGSLTLTANGTPLYQQTAGSFSRKGIKFDETVNQRLTAAAGVGPNPTTTSTVWLGIWQLGARPTGVRCLQSAGTTEQARRLTTADKIRCVSTGNTADSVGSAYVNKAQLIGLDYDRANSVARVVTESETITPTYVAASADAAKGFGDAGAIGAPLATLVWGCMWSGATAEGLDLPAVIAALGAP